MKSFPRKVSFAADKKNWHPSPLPGPIVLVTTVNQSNEVNVAPKSWVTMIAFKPPMLLFGCNRSHTTMKNLEEVGEFVLNIPGEDLMKRVYDMPSKQGEKRLEDFGLNSLPSKRVSPPGILECKAHLECSLDHTEGIGSEEEVAVFGKILEARIDEKALKGSNLDRYAYLRPCFFLENGIYGVIDRARTVKAG